MHIKMLAFLIIFQIVVGCRKDPGVIPPPAATNIIFQSADNGTSWRDVSAGLPVGVGVGRVTVANDEIYLSADTGMYHSNASLATPVWTRELFINWAFSNIYTGRTGIYASQYGTGFYQNLLGTGIWLPMFMSLEDKKVQAFLETPDGALFVGCETGIFKSADNGISWKQVLEDATIFSFATADGVLIAGSYPGLLRSTDGGEHWDWVMTEDGSAYGTRSIKGGFAAITDGGDDRLKVIVTNRIRVSTDGGNTWSFADENLARTHQIYDIAQAGDYLFCSCDTGIFRSGDLGKTWELVRPNNDPKKMYSLAVSGNMIYIVSTVGC